MAATPPNGKPCQAKQSLTQAAFYAYLPEESRTRNFFERMTFDEWEIVSFNPQNREVCVRLLNDSGDILMSFFIPTIVLT